MPLSTTSASISAIRVEASGPVRISGRYPVSPAARAASSISFCRAAASPAGGADRPGPGVHGLPGEEFEVPAAGAERHDLKKVRGAVDDVNRLRADGTGGPEEDDLARLHG